MKYYYVYLCFILIYTKAKLMYCENFEQLLG